MFSTMFDRGITSSFDPWSTEVWRLCEHVFPWSHMLGILDNHEILPEHVRSWSRHVWPWLYEHVWPCSHMLGILDNHEILPEHVLSWSKHVWPWSKHVRPCWPLLTMLWQCFMADHVSLLTMFWQWTWLTVFHCRPCSAMFHGCPIYRACETMVKHVHTAVKHGWPWSNKHV